MAAGFSQARPAGKIFRCVFANAALFHVPSQELPRVLLELHTALKPGGVLFSSNSERPPPPYTPLAVGARLVASHRRRTPKGRDKRDRTAHITAAGRGMSK